MKNTAFIILLAFAQVLVQAQTPGKNLSLKEAIQVALNNRFDLQADQYNTLIAQNNMDKSKREWIPDVSGNAAIRYNLLLQGTLIPAGFGGLQEPKVLALGAKHVTAFGLDINETVYKPSRQSDKSLAELQILTSKENLVVVENQLRAKIAEAYFNVNLKKLQWSMLEKVKKRYATYMNITEGRVKNGAALESEYLKTKLDFDNAEIEISKAEQAYQLSLSYLKYLMNIPTETKIVLTDSLQAPDAALVSMKSMENFKRPEIRLLALQKQAYALGLKGAKDRFLPTVSLFANASVQFLYNNFNYAKTDYWNPYGFVGVKMAVPITDRYKSVETLHEFSLKTMRLELQEKQMAADINFEIEKAETELKNALLNLKSSKMSYELSNELYRQQVQQFELGALLYTNILDTERSLNNAEQNYVRAVYDFYIAKISLNKAMGDFE